MKNILSFIFSLSIVLVFHTYVLSSYQVDQVHAMVMQPVIKRSSVLNLQRASMRESESIVKSIVEEKVKPKPVVKKVAVKIPVPLKKKKTKKKKKRSKKKKKKVKNNKGESRSKNLLHGPISGTGQVALRENYFSKVWRLIEEKKRYPRIAKKLRQEGSVNILVTIGKNGRIQKITLVKKSPFERLNRAAKAIFKEIETFPPIPKELHKSSLTLTVPIRYSIKL